MIIACKITKNNLYMQIFFKHSAEYLLLRFGTDIVITR